jgi:hypothetical protein
MRGENLQVFAVRGVFGFLAFGPFASDLFHGGNLL